MASEGQLCRAEYCVECCGQVARGTVHHPPVLMVPGGRQETDGVLAGEAVGYRCRHRRCVRVPRHGGYEN